MIAYKKRTGKTIDQKDVEVGRIQFHETLTQEDFDNAGKVNEFFILYTQEVSKSFLLTCLTKTTPTLLCIILNSTIL